MKALQLLAELSMKAKLAKYPNTPPSFIPPTKFSDKKANGLTKCVIEFLRIKGHQAERISNTGRVIDRSKIYTDVVGRQRKIGSVDWVPGTGTNGTADISATIKGRSVKIEVKVGKDTQKDKQKQYQKDVEAAGGIYVIATSFQQFYDWYEEIKKEA